ncbi:MAG: SCO family protein [Sediminibacterium sp.]
MWKYCCLIIVVVIQACGGKENVDEGLPFYVTADFTPHWFTEKELKGQIHQIPDFSFINQSGQAVTASTVQNKIYVANFFFTNCPGICKRLTNNVSLVQDAFVNDDEILILSHSVTPEADSVGRLQQYAKQYKINQSQWHLLTGNRGDIYSIARKAYFADEDLGETQNENDFLHTENVLLIDKHRRIRGVYKGTSETDIRNLITDIKRLKKES